MKLFYKKSITILGILVLAGGILMALFIGGAYLYLSPRLPNIETHTESIWVQRKTVTPICNFSLDVL